MPTYWSYDTQTTNYTAGLQYTGVSGFTIGGSSVTSFFIPMLLTQYNSPTVVQTIGSQPLIPVFGDNYGMAYGGQFTYAQGATFPKITLAGTIDAPLTTTTETGTYSGATAVVPDIQLGGIPMHWVTILKVFFEGSYTTHRFDPTYFQDPYGRQYNSPRIYDLTATYVAGAPARANFTMVLMPPKSNI